MQSSEPAKCDEKAHDSSQAKGKPARSAALSKTTISSSRIYEGVWRRVGDSKPHKSMTDADKSGTYGLSVPALTCTRQLSAQ